MGQAVFIARGKTGGDEAEGVVGDVSKKQLARVVAASSRSAVGPDAKKSSISFYC